MQSVLIVIHLLVVIALVAVVLLQRSEGGVLGAGGGGGFMTGRGQANALSRATAILGDAVLRLRAADVDPRRLEPRAAFADRIDRAGVDDLEPTSSRRAAGSLLDQLKSMNQKPGGAPAPVAPAAPAARRAAPDAPK